jgi:periplasmic protein TonB
MRTMVACVIALVTGVVLGTAQVPQASSQGMANPPPGAKPPDHSAKPGLSHPPRVTFKPKPEYSAEALTMRLEGQVLVNIRVGVDGGVEVLGLKSGLGHGLDEEAMRAAKAMRFKPATDSAGNPVVWVGFTPFSFWLTEEKQPVEK